MTFALQPLSSEEDKEESRDVRKRSGSMRDSMKKLESSGVEERSMALAKRVEGDGEGDRQGAVECGAEESEMAKSCEDEELVIVDDSDATVVGSEVVEGDEKEY